MIYTFNLAIPANTTKLNRVKQACKLDYGVVNHVAIAFPPGPKALAHLVIHRYASQVWPSNPEGSFAWDDYTLEFDEAFELFEVPYELNLLGWNEDDSYPHTVTVRFEVGGKTWGFEDLLNLQNPISYTEG